MNIERERASFLIALDDFARSWGDLALYDRDAAHLLDEIKIVLRRREEWGAAIVATPERST
jgi:hypothetical protein